jgi:rare lipoprotein A
LRPSTSLHCALIASALTFATAAPAGALTLATAAPAAAADGTGGASAPDAASMSPTAGGTSPAASIARVGVGTRRLDVRAGRRAVVRGTVLPRTPGASALLQVRRDASWRTLDRDRTSALGDYRLQRRMRRPMSARARVVVAAAGQRVHRHVGRLNVYRAAIASWYGPGLYGNHLACGGRLGYGTLGVANLSLPCGARVTLRHRGRVLRVPVIDRGPYVAGREFDLTAATARRLRFHGHGWILVTR